MMKTLGLLTAIVMSFLVGRFSVSQIFTPSEANEIRLSSVPQPLPHQVDSRELIQTNLKLEAEINQLKKQLLHQQQSTNPAAPTEQKAETTNNFSATNHALSDAQELTEQLATDSNNFFQQIKEKFNQEPVDPHWATQQQQHLDHWLKSTKDLENFSVEDITCKTTNCRITFPVSSTENSDELAQIISKISRQSSDIKSSIIYDHSIPGSLNLYVAR